MSSEYVQLAQTESLFREVNERIAETAARFLASEAEFVCECSDPECTTRVPATLSEYEQVRSRSTHFLLRPGHERREIERVVRRGRRHEVVEKVGVAIVATVRRLDPRRRGGAKPGLAGS